MSTLLKLIESELEKRGIKVLESAPPGFEGTVKALKKHKEITNPWALAYYMKDKGYKSHVPEGKLPADPSQATPDQIQTLAEEKKEVKAEKMPQTASVSEEPPVKGKLQQAMDKATPDVDKLSDFKVAAKVETAKKIEPDITGVSKDSDKELKDEKNETKVKEGKLPADPSQATPDQIQTLAEERVLTTISDETVAKDIASKYSGARVVPDAEGKQWMVIVSETALAEKSSRYKIECKCGEKYTTGPVADANRKVTKCPKCGKVDYVKMDKITEEKTSEPTAAEVRAAEVPGVKDEKDSKLSGVAKSDPKEPSIKSAEADVSKSPANPVVGDKGASTGKQDVTTDQKIDPGTTTVTNQDAAKVSGGDPTTEPEKPAVKDTNAVAGTKAEKEDKLTPESKVCDKCKKEVCVCEKTEVKEDVEVSVKSDDNSATVSVTPTGTSVSTSEVPTAEVAPAPIATEAPAEEVEEPEMTEEESEEMAERIFVSDYLSSLGESKLTEKQKQFVAEAKSKKMSKKNKEKVEKKLKSLRDKKEKK